VKAECSIFNARFSIFNVKASSVEWMKPLLVGDVALKMVVQKALGGAAY